LDLASKSNQGSEFASKICTAASIYFLKQHETTKSRFYASQSLNFDSRNLEAETLLFYCDASLNTLNGN
jgi:hypothetical protein